MSKPLKRVTPLEFKTKEGKAKAIALTWGHNSVYLAAAPYPGTWLDRRESVRLLKWLQKVTQ